MKKEKTVFDELMAQYEKFTDRKVEKAAKLAADSERTAGEIEEIQRKLEKEVSVMTPEEYKTNKKRMAELNDEKALTDAQKAEIDKLPATSDEEYQEWTNAAAAEFTRIKSELAIGSCSLLMPLAKLYEKNITEFEKLRALRFTFEGAVGNRKDPFFGLANELPGYVLYLCRVLLAVFNDLDKMLNDGENRTECVNREELSEARRKMLEISQRVGFTRLIGTSVPTWNEANETIKYE